MTLRCLKLFDVPYSDDNLGIPNTFSALACSLCLNWACLTSDFLMTIHVTIIFNLKRTLRLEELDNLKIEW